MTAPGVFGFFDDDDNKLKNLQKFDKTAAMDGPEGDDVRGRAQLAEGHPLLQLL